MNKDFRKTALLVGAWSILGLCYSPVAMADTGVQNVQSVQQTKRVTGVVNDAMGPVIGATVLEKGTTNGVVTDMSGRFSINVRPGATLQVSYVGYTTQEVRVGNQSTLSITLVEDDQTLDEVVVVGYGTMKKSDLAGASASMDEKALKGANITNLDQSFQGRVTGVTSVMTSGAPGSASSVRVRGQATINAGAEPLYVIDGVIVQGGGQSGADFGLGDALGNGSVSTVSPLSTINPADIVSMEILKDASATAIYGAQGANGVVLITTKRGKAGEAKFTYDGSFSVNRQVKRLDLLNLREFAEYQLAGCHLPHCPPTSAPAERTGWYRCCTLLCVGWFHESGRYHHRLELPAFLGAHQSRCTIEKVAEAGIERIVHLHKGRPEAGRL